MKRLLMICIATLMVAAFLPEDAAARDGALRPRIAIYAKPRYLPERGALYGYSPGVYLLGRTGLLYGPYPFNPNAPVRDLRY